MSKLLWMALQAAAIGGLTWVQSLGPTFEPGRLGLMILVNTILVAFLTAVIVNLWDWLLRLTGVRRPLRHEGEPEREVLRPPAPSWFLGQLPEKRSHPRIGQEPR